MSKSNSDQLVHLTVPATASLSEYGKYYLSMDFEAINGTPAAREAFNLLRERSIYFDAIIENFIDGVFITDGASRVIKINRAYEQISGISRDEIQGLDMREVERRELISQSVTLVAVREKAPVTMDQYMRRTGKKTLVSCNPLLDENGEITMVVSSVRDVTELESLRRRVMEEEERAERFQSALEALRAQLDSPSRIVVQDEKMIALMQQAQKVAKLDATVLLQGETGTGKDEFARFIHENSPRRDGHFIKVNCGAIMGTLMESEFFGYEKGAFSGARSTGKTGLFEVADKGTIFLDEIGEMPLDMQVKLLRVIQEKEFTRVGGVTPKLVDVRIIAASNRDLREMVERNEFRRDLYYRLNIVPLQLPPLRQRPGDIIPLARHFIREFNEQYGLDITFSSAALQRLAAHSWPGNVRELKNTLERVMIMSNTPIVTAEDFHFDQQEEGPAIKLKKGLDLKSLVDEYEARYILQAYERGGSVSAGAELVGLRRSTFAAKLQKYSRQRNVGKK
ncbi:sigma 54-interacting transcriptional regulator [Desulfovibrio sp. OttesenSCG-928-C14]|nr:sigma 54-interacting transcriptional regulator [Desulfovibrio sp. OttesenSCG-928-C14]